MIDKVAGSKVDTQNVFDIEDLLINGPHVKNCLQVVQSHPASAQLIEERHEIRSPIYRKREINSDVDHIVQRVRKTHDLHHILTGFSFDDCGEFGVISVSIGQIQYPAYQLLCLLGSFLSFATNAPSKGNEAPLAYNFDLITEGIRIARQAKPLFPIKFEEGLDRPIEEWRTELNIEPVRDGLWSWYSRPILAAAIAE